MHQGLVGSMKVPLKHINVHVTKAKSWKPNETYLFNKFRDVVVNHYYDKGFMSGSDPCFAFTPLTLIINALGRRIQGADYYIRISKPTTLTEEDPRKGLAMMKWTNELDNYIKRGQMGGLSYEEMSEYVNQQPPHTSHCTPRKNEDRLRNHLKENKADEPRLRLGRDQKTIIWEYGGSVACRRVLADWFESEPSMVGMRVEQVRVMEV